MTDQRNLIVAILLAVGILFGYQYLFVQPQIEIEQRRAQTAGEAQTPAGTPSLRGDAQRATLDPAEARARAVTGAARIPIRSDSLSGSLRLQGGLIDDLTLRHYRKTVAPDSPNIALLSPLGAPSPYYVQLGWLAADKTTPVPGAETPWQAKGTVLAPGKPLTLSWDNGEGLTFTRTLSIDEDYLVRVVQTVANRGERAVGLHPYALASRTGEPETSGFFILHEGPIGVFDNTLTEYDYDDLEDDAIVRETAAGGWIGITDKYWLVALIPDQKAAFSGTFSHAKSGTDDKYQVDYVQREPVTLAPGATLETVSHLFIGAKVVNLLDRYATEKSIPLFDRAVDFGWFYFLTKPLFLFLQYIHSKVGNLGIAILTLTVLIKLLFFPLANKSYKAMSKMKLLQPEMMKLRERFKDDKQRLQQEMMGLYKKKKVNPLAGCLPIAIQIPVFFALYKVLLVSIEMRHAPFYGWIKDLSAPDPTNLFNLFGIIPWTPPEFLILGIWPLLMGVTMWLQQKLNPQPPDPMQARIMMMLPIVFTFLFASFPAGLVIYYTWNNILSIAQQWVIMRRAGAPT